MCDEDVAKIGQITSLRELEIQYCDEITDVGVIALSRLSHLSIIRLVITATVTGYRSNCYHSNCYCSNGNHSNCYCSKCNHSYCYCLRCNGNHSYCYRCNSNHSNCYCSNGNHSNCYRSNSDHSNSYYFNYGSLIRSLLLFHSFSLTLCRLYRCFNLTSCSVSEIAMKCSYLNQLVLSDCSEVNTAYSHEVAIVTIKTLVSITVLLSH